MLLWLQTNFSQGGFWIFFGCLSVVLIVLAIWLRQPD